MERPADASSGWGPSFPVSDNAAARVQLSLGPHGRDRNNSVKIDGEEWLVRGINLRAACDDLTEATIDILVESAEVTAEADVQVNGHYLSEEMARAFYQDLKNKFED
jgi:hypothetical protein